MDKENSIRFMITNQNNQIVSMRNSNILCIFVMRTDHKFNGVSTRNTETKIRGRHTVASTAVFSMLRMGSVRSDRPSLFTQILFLCEPRKTMVLL